MSTLTTPKVSTAVVFGIWNLEYNCWMLADNGYDFRTTKLEWAELACTMFEKDGDKVEPRVYPINNPY